MKGREELFSIFFAFTFDRLGHHAGGSFGDGATGAFESYFLYRIVFKVQINRQMVAAKRVEAFSRMIRALKLAKVPRLLVVQETVGIARGVQTCD